MYAVKCYFSHMNSNKSIFITLFCVIVIDAMGMMLPLPVMGALVLSTHSPLLSSTLSLHAREILYGFVMASFILGMFIGSPILGDISDHIGRKKGLLICLLGVAVGSAISAVGVLVHSMSMLIFGRFFAGFASGSQSIAQAAIIDISTEETRTINLSRIVLAITLGIIVGPLLGGLTGNNYFLTHYGLSLPFWACGVIALVNANVLYKIYQENFTKIDRGPISYFRGFISFIQAFRYKSVALLSLCFIAIELAWCLYFNDSGLFMLNQFHYSALQLGLFFAFMGVGSSIGMTIGIKLIMRYLKTDQNALLFSIVGMAVSLMYVAITSTIVGQWIGCFFTALFVSVTYTTILSLYSRHASETHQGWMMGVAASVATFAWVVMSSFSGELAYINLRAPFWIGAISTLLSAFILMAYNKMPVQQIK